MQRVCYIVMFSTFFICCENRKEKNQIIDVDIESLYERYNSIKKQIEAIENKSSVNKKTNIPLIKVVRAKVKEFNKYVTSKAEVKTEKDVVVNAKTNGLIENINVKRGDRVKKNQIIAVIEADVIKRNIEELKINLDFSNDVYIKQKKLWNKKIGSEMEYLNAKNKKENLEKRINSLLSQLEMTLIKAPFDGIIDYIFAKKGEMAGTSKNILRLLSLEELYLDVDIPENYVNNIKIGAVSQIYFPFVDKFIKSKVSWISNYINQDNRTFKIQLNLVNNNYGIKLNSLADVKVKVLSLNDKIVIPSRSLKRDMKEDIYVLTLDIVEDKKGIIKKKYVSISDYYEGSTLINEGIKENMLVVLEGVNIKEGDIVEAKEIDY